MWRSAIGVLIALVPGLVSAADVRARLDVTGWVDATTTVPAALVTPAMAQNIGPGSHLLIDIPNEGTFGCTANFVWVSGNVRYLGAAGHCFLPASAVATHGPGANYNASGVVVRVCVSDCSFGGETGFTVTGTATASLVDQEKVTGRMTGLLLGSRAAAVST